MQSTAAALFVACTCFIATPLAWGETTEERIAHNQYDAAISQADANYKIAIVSCEGLTGNEKSVCRQNAISTRDKAKADARAFRDSKDADVRARETRLDADYDLARQKCQDLTSDARDACISEAKAQFER